jgi:ATP-binding cassette, subfamily F, member 3
MLTISNLTYRINGRLIFEETSALVQENWKVGLVGGNGAGKSTLFKLIAGELAADGGDISLSDKYTFGMVRQDLPDDDTPLIDVVLAADEERTKLLADSETEQDPDKLADIFTRLMDKDAYSAPARAAQILAGLGFKDDDLQEPISSFSGGWRMRVALAAALFVQPDFLLLDEPTNHLDLEAVMWLENHLAAYPKTMMIISHDRDILNKCVDHVIHVERKKLTTYTGNYDTFERERAEKMMGQQKLHERQKAQREHMEAFILRFKAKASKARQAQSRMKALEKMDVVEAVMADRGIKFSFPKPTELAPPLLSMDHADVGYVAGKPILKDVHQHIDMDDRIALLGANGNGKSTLIKLIAGRLKPMGGDVRMNNKTKIGYFSQHQAEEMDMDSTPYQVLMQKMKGKNETEVRNLLGRYGFGKDLADNRIKTLSGGEKAKLLFAMIAYEAPHLLLLDEPTNHLDMDAREALVQALNEFEGAAVIVSHDPSMIERAADRLWLVADGEVTPYDGDLETYRQLVIDQRRAERKAEKASKTPKVDRKKLEAEKRERHPIFAAAMDEAEKVLSKLNNQKKKIEAEMGVDGFYNDKKKAEKVQAEYGKIARETELAEEAWMEAVERFENADG